jgi:hypothetical protein
VKFAPIGSLKISVGDNGKHRYLRQTSETGISAEIRVGTSEMLWPLALMGERLFLLFGIYYLIEVIRLNTLTKKSNRLRNDNAAATTPAAFKLACSVLEKRAS